MGIADWPVILIAGEGRSVRNIGSVLEQAKRLKELERENARLKKPEQLG